MTFIHGGKEVRALEKPMTSFIDRLFEQILWIEMKLVKFITRPIIDQSTHGETPQRTGRSRL
jgi:hypothetical protein